MRISFVYDAAYPWVKGGVERRIYEFGKRLVKEGIEVKVYTLKWWDGPDTYIYDGITYQSLGGKKGLYNKGRRSFIEAIYFAIRTFNIKPEHGEILEAQSFPYFHLFPLRIKTSLRGSKLVITWHEVWKGHWINYLGGRIYLGLVGIAIEKLAARLSRYNLSNSNATANFLSSIGQNSIMVLPSGVDIAQIESVNPNISSYDIVAISRFVKEKNVALLVESITHLKKLKRDVKAVIIGGGPEFQQVSNLIQDIDLVDNIRLTGFLEDYDDVISIIKSSKIFVSLSTREGFSLAVLEAMACGVPSVIADSHMNAGKELVLSQPETGWICAPDARAVAETLSHALSMSAETRENCLTKSKLYDWNILTSKLIKYYEQIPFKHMERKGITDENTTHL